MDLEKDGGGVERRRWNSVLEIGGEDLWGESGMVSGL